MTKVKFSSSCFLKSYKDFFVCFSCTYLLYGRFGTPVYKAKWKCRFLHQSSVSGNLHIFLASQSDALQDADTRKHMGQEVISEQVRRNKTAMQTCKVTSIYINLLLDLSAWLQPFLNLQKVFNQIMCTLALKNSIKLRQALYVR